MSVQSNYGIWTYFINIIKISVPNEQNDNEKLMFCKNRSPKVVLKLFFKCLAVNSIFFQYALKLHVFRSYPLNAMKTYKTQLKKSTETFPIFLIYSALSSNFCFTSTAQ